MSVAGSLWLNVAIEGEGADCLMSFTPRIRRTGRRDSPYVARVLAES
ncbi:MAG: hypothetical protein ABSB09_01865 [Acidimicrobiales bacterium]